MTDPAADATHARQLLHKAESIAKTPDQFTAIANAYARLAALPTPDATLIDYDAIDAMLTAAGVPDLIDEPLSARVGWLIERHCDAKARLETYEMGDDE